MSSYWTDKTDGEDVIYAADFNEAFDAVEEDVKKRVDKVEGKGLSTNDFTDEDKDKLDGVEAGAQANTLEKIKINGTEQKAADKSVDILTVEKIAESVLAEGSASMQHLFVNADIPEKGIVTVEVPSTVAGTPYIQLALGSELESAFVPIASTQSTRATAGSTYCIRLEYETIGGKIFGIFSVVIGGSAYSPVFSSGFITPPSTVNYLRAYGSSALPSGTKMTLYRRNI